CWRRRSPISGRSAATRSSSSTSCMTRRPCSPPPRDDRYGLHGEGRLSSLLRGHGRRRADDLVPPRGGRQSPELVAAGAGLRGGVSLHHGGSARLRAVAGRGGRPPRPRAPPLCAGPPP